VSEPSKTVDMTLCQSEREERQRRGRKGIVGRSAGRNEGKVSEHWRPSENRGK
jgi:hypothetical protein